MSTFVGQQRPPDTASVLDVCAVELNKRRGSKISGLRRFRVEGTSLELFFERVDSFSALYGFRAQAELRIERKCEDMGPASHADRSPWEPRTSHDAVP